MGTERDMLWSVIEARDAALAELQTEARRWELALREKEEMIRELRASLDGNEQIRKLTATLEAKEAVIREQQEALAKYRDAYAVTGIFIRPINFIVLSIRGAWRRTLGKLGPRLGILRQHAPTDLQLPSPYVPSTPVQSLPSMSLVTPSYGQALYIERTIHSVLSQDYPGLQYVVQDGGSRDGTVDILLRFAPRLTAWDSSPDGGQSEAINVAFAKTTGEIMAWLNADDILFPGALAYVGEFFATHPDVDVVYGHRVLIDENDKEIGRWILPQHDDAVLSWADFVPQETLFWRRRIWERVGGRVDEGFRFAMDWDLLLRFREAGACFERLPRFLGGFRVHPQQKTSADISDVGFREMDRLRERALGRVPSRIEVVKAIMPYLMKHNAVDLRWRVRNGLGMRT
jgi:glycosyltransferase involved in cell wall biosynthesis